MPPRFSFNTELTSSVNAPIYDDETLANFIKQSTQQQRREKKEQKRERERERERGPKSKPEGQNPKWVTMGGGA
jgi:hypothetical protein